MTIRFNFYKKPQTMTLKLILSNDAKTPCFFNYPNSGRRQLV